MRKNRNFSLLIIGQSFANIGDVLYMIGIISTIFVLTGSATAASFVPFTITSSMFISSLVTPLLIGKVNLKWLLVVSQFGKTIFIVILGLLLIVISESNYFLVFLVIGGVAFLDGCANPIQHTLIPHYVESNHLIRANGIAEMVTQFIQTGMWFVGSLLLVILGSKNLVFFVSFLFMVSSIMLSFLENVTQNKEVEETSKLEQIKKGWKTLFHTPVLRKIALIDIFETIAGTVWIAAILYVFVSDALNVGEKWWGFINGAFFLGLIAGSIYCVGRSTFLNDKLEKVIFIGSFFSFLVTVLFSLTTNPFIALFLSFGVGVFGQLKSIPQQTVIQTSIPKIKLSTVYTSLGAISTGVFGVASIVMGIMADWLGVRSVFLISGIVLAAVTLIVYRNKHLFVKNIVE